MFFKEFQAFCKDKKCVAFIADGGCYNMHSEMCCYTAYQYFEWVQNRHNKPLHTDNQSQTDSVQAGPIEDLIICETCGSALGCR